MGNVMRGFTILCAIGFFGFGASLDSMEHFDFIFGGFVFCMFWCILYGLWTQRRRD